MTDSAGQEGAPDAAWRRVVEGNERFVLGRPEHPGQDATRRSALLDGQQPFALVFGCSDSRVAAEILFDQGLGDLFVVRTAGHAVDSAVLGSLEYGVHVLGIPLILVLGHDGCGAVQAAAAAVSSGEVPPGAIGELVGLVAPSVRAALADGLSAGREVSLTDMEAEHVRRTRALLAERSPVLADAMREGRLAVVGATYSLADGKVAPV